MAKELSFVEKLKKQMEKDSIKAKVSVLSDEENKIIYEPSGILALDIVSGRGLPRGRWVEIFGVESGGKSLVSAIIGASFQKRGKDVVWIDMERTADPEWYSRVGLDPKKLIVIKPESAEDAFDALKACIEAKAGLVVIDSVASMATEKEMGESAGKQNMAIVARMLSTELRKLTGPLADAGTIVIMINQLRSTMALTQYEKQETTTGGKALPFYCTLRFRVSRVNAPGSYTKDKNDIFTAHTIRVKNIKNKVGAPGLERSFMLIYDGGPDNRTALIGRAIEKGLIRQGGAWFYMPFNGQELKACGLPALVKLLSTMPDAQKYLLDTLNIDPFYYNMFDIDKRELEYPSGLAEIAEAEEEDYKKK